MEEAIIRFTSSLSESDRLLFLARYWHLRSVSELASETGSREGTVKTRLFRLREKLKKQLKKEGYIEGRQRKSIYMLNMASTESPSFQLIREAVQKMSQTEKIYAQISLAVRVFETEAEEDQELWVFPSFYHGGVSGIFWARIDRKASDCTIEWEMTGPEEESWVRRIDMLGELSSEESPVALVLDKNRLLAVINSQAYLLKEDPDVPYAETIDLTGVQAFDRIPEGVVWELSMKTVRKYELVRLTAEQKARYANIIYSADTVKSSCSMLRMFFSSAATVR